jgi:hypothetical protein
MTISGSSTSPRDFSGLRVVHAANYQFAKDGRVFFNPDIKMNQGLIQAGCFVYPFSINDRARMLSLTGSKTFGKGRANTALIRTCRNIAPDLLILGHAQYISKQTLLAIRNEVPEIRIGLWYVDPLWVPQHIQHLHDRVDALDAIFTTTAGDLLKGLSRPGCPAAFIPNPVEPSIERHRAFENAAPKYDIVFIGSDKRAPERRKFLKVLTSSLSNARLGIFGCLGNRSIFGHEKEQLLRDSRMSLNLSRRTDVELYSSDRIAQIAGNGQLILTPAGNGIEQLFSPDEAVFFSDVDDLVAQVRRLRADDVEAVRIACNGWKKAHQTYSARNVAAFMIALTMRDESFMAVPWADHIYHAADPSESHVQEVRVA